MLSLHPRKEEKSATVVPLTIVTGFLGSGKTTLINHLLHENNGRERLAIVKNEIGSVSVDSDVYQGQYITVKDLLNGCVCCTLIGELEESLTELVSVVHPDRIILETSGAANPAILAVNIDRIPCVNRDLIVTVIDAEHFLGYRDKSIIARLQHKFTDLIVLNKVGTVDENTIEKVLDDVYALRPGIPVFRTVDGSIPLEVVFGGIQKEWGSFDSIKKFDNASRVDEASGVDDSSGRTSISQTAGHLDSDSIETFFVEMPRDANKSCLVKILSNLSDEYYRVKGFILFDDSKWWLINWVCGRLDIGISREASCRKSGLIFIGRHIGIYEEMVRKKLEQCLVGHANGDKV